MVIMKKYFILVLLCALAFPSWAIADKATNDENPLSRKMMPDDGDFLPDTVNVFHIAKDVSEIFMNAINSSVYHDVNGDTTILNSIFKANYTSNDIGQAYQSALDEQIKAKRGDFGLNLKGDYTENFTPGISVDEDLTYKRRFYVGLEWDIIKGGLFDAGNQIHQMKMESILNEYENLEYAEKENYRYLFNYINYIFNLKKVDVLAERKGLVKKQLDFTKQLYHLRYVGWEKVLKYQAKLEDIDHQIFQLQNFNKHIPSNIPDTLMSNPMSADDLPLFDVNLDSLIKIYYNHHSEDTVTQIKLAIYKDNLKWWKDITLKPFVRYNMYMDEFNIFKNYGSAGVTMRVPLRFHNKGKLMKAQESIYQSEQYKELEAGDNELVNIYAEFGFKLKQIKDFYYRKMLNDELIRKELVKKEYRDVAFNPVYTLGLIDEKKAIESEIIDLKKRMYINLVRLSFYLEDRTPTDFITILKPQDFTGRYNGSVKMFVNKDDVEAQSPSAIANYLWKNEFVDVILESDIDTIPAYLITILEKTQFANVFFSMMRRVPLNGAYPDVNSDVNQVLEWNNSRIIGLHYELELLRERDSLNEISEVAVSDWVSTITQQARNSQVRLSIGIPAGLNVSLLNRIFDKFDLVYVHETGIPNRDRVENDYARELNLDKERLVLSLQGTDFVDRLHLENYMANLFENSGINNFAFSDFSSMMDVDFKTFEKGNEIDLQPEQLIASVREQIYDTEDKKGPIFIVQETDKEALRSEPEVQATAVTKEEPSEEPEGINESEQADVIYRIQIAASRVKLRDSVLEKFKVEDIREIQIDGYYKYTIGSYQTQKEAINRMKEYNANSFSSGAFIVTY